MSRRMIQLVLCVSCVLFLGGVAQAAVSWDGGGSDNDWMTPENWNPDGVPGSGDQVQIYDGDEPNVYTEVPEIFQILFSRNSASGAIPSITVEPLGILPVSNKITIGNHQNTIGWMTIRGQVDCGNNFYVSWKPATPGSDCDLYMDKYGRLDVKYDLLVSHSALCKGYVHLDYGTIDARRLRLAGYGDLTGDGAAVVDIKNGGTLRLDTNRTAEIQPWIDSGIAGATGVPVVTSYGGEGTVVMIYDPNDEGGHTTLTAFHPLYPVPDDGEFNMGTPPTELSWTLPEPNQMGETITCTVSLGTSPGSLTEILSDSTDESVDVSSIVVGQKEYYWRMKVTSSAFGVLNDVIFRFDTINLPPIADAGDDVGTWLPPGGTRDVQLDGSGSSDPEADSLTYLWSVIAEPNAVTNPATFVGGDNTSVDSTVRMTLAGEYTLQLVVNDGTSNSNPDTMLITVYENACKHAIAQPGFEFLAHDSNSDCKVDLLDLADLAAQWLDENSSIE